MLVLEIAIVLDLFTRIFDFGKAKGSRAAFEEVAERGETGEILFLALTGYLSGSIETERKGNAFARHGRTHSAVSIFWKVESAWSKNP